MSNGHMNIGLYANDVANYFIGAWRLETSVAETESYHNHLKMAQIAESAKLDAVFYADSPELHQGNDGLGTYEPLTLLSAIAARTERIGLAATQTTTFDQPYHVARRFSSLDHISSGRAAWNVVTGTSPSAGKNFNNIPLMDGDDRYEQADEFIEVVTALWDSWSKDAVIRDRATGEYKRESEVRPINHEGKYYQVQGPLNIWRSPQGRPVVILAGGSVGARKVAAKRADVMFTVQASFDAAVDFRNEMRTLTAAAGRNPDSLKVMPGVAFVIGSTEQEARNRLTELTELGNSEHAMDLLCNRLEFDLRGYDLDERLPEIEISHHQSGYRVNIINLARTRDMTIRQLRDHTAASRSHHFICGTPEQIADGMTDWFQNGACDGFNIMPASNPIDLLGFTEHVVPILQRKNVFRKEYEGATMRENLGLPRVD